jgi:hypothetical protein
MHTTELSQTEQATLYWAGLVTHPPELLESYWKGQGEMKISEPVQYSLRSARLGKILRHTFRLPRMLAHPNAEVGSGVEWLC